jgi:hypothetical protein
MLRLNTRIGGSDSTPTTAFAGPRRCRFRTKGSQPPTLASGGCPVGVGITPLGAKSAIPFVAIRSRAVSMWGRLVRRRCDRRIRGAPSKEAIVSRRRGFRARHVRRRDPRNAFRGMNWGLASLRSRARWPLVPPAKEKRSAGLWGVVLG